MKYLTAILLSILFSVPLLSQNNDIVIGKIDSLYSNILNESRKIWVHVPDSDANSIYTKQNYPVIYLLDGDGHFTSVVGMIDHISKNSIAPKMIVVGIPNTNRMRDLTPTKPKPNAAMSDSTAIAQAGGGKEFRKFIKEELIPFIEKKYPTQPNRMLIGHSLGGLFVMDTFFEEPELFSSYISIDPSMWWDETSLLKKIQQADFTNSKYRDKNLYMGIANTLEMGMDTLTVKNDTTQMTAHIRSIFKLNESLNKKSKDLFNYQSQYYGEDSHGSAPLITTYDGLRFIYDFYEIDLPFNEIMEGKTDAIQEIKDHYKMVSLKLGYTVKPDEEFINNMGYQFLQMDKMEVAKKYFMLNVEYHPESSNVYDSLGDYFVAVKDNKNAKENFEKALQLKDNNYTREKLEKLKM